MQVYAIYAPAHHTPGKVQATAAGAEADKDDKPGEAVDEHAELPADRTLRALR